MSLSTAVADFKANKGGYRKLARQHGVREDELRKACQDGQQRPQPTPKAPQLTSRAEWLHTQLTDIEARRKTEKGATAFTALAREARMVRDLLDEELARVAEQHEAERLAKLTSVPPAERRHRLRERADALPLDDLEVFVRSFIDRHGGRVELRLVDAT